jgi:hypothetical protein
MSNLPILISQAATLTVFDLTLCEAVDNRRTENALDLPPACIWQEIGHCPRSRGFRVRRALQSAPVGDVEGPVSTSAGKSAVMEISFHRESPRA